MTRKQAAELDGLARLHLHLGDTEHGDGHITRDVEPWPAPEYLETVNTEELGNLGLTADEEAAIVAFMKTLSDGYAPAP